MKNGKLNFFLIFLVVIFGLVIAGSAFAYPPLVPCGRQGQEPCTQCDFLKLTKNLTDFVLFFIIPVIGTLLIVIAGFMILLGGAQPSLISRGKSIFWGVIVGILIISTSWLIVNFILKSLAGNSNIANEWYRLECKTTVKTITGVPADKICAYVAENNKYTCINNSNEKAKQNKCSEVTECKDKNCQSLDPGLCGKEKEIVGGNCSGVSCSDSNLNICGQNTSTNCSESAVNRWNDQIAAGAANKQICPGIDTVKFVKAIISQESGGNPSKPAADGLSYGILQIRPKTANDYKSGCTTANIDANWLKNSANIEASVCIAINYLKSLVSPCGCDIRQLAAGYNGGGAAKGACDFSQSCASCSICSSDKTRRWECLWDGPDGEHQACNAERPGSSFNATRRYVPKVSYCYGRF